VKQELSSSHKPFTAFLEKAPKIAAGEREAVQTSGSLACPAAL
jgi:hypothetical protein